MITKSEFEKLTIKSDIYIDGVKKEILRIDHGGQIWVGNIVGYDYSSKEVSLTPPKEKKKYYKFLLKDIDNGGFNGHRFLL